VLTSFTMTRVAGFSNVITAKRRSAQLPDRVLIAVRPAKALFAATEVATQT
jgi:hypothetical protein